MLTILCNDKVKTNLIALAEQKRAMPTRRPRVKLVMVAVRQNAESLVDFARFAGQVQADGIMVQVLNDVGDPGLLELAPSEAEASALRQQVPEAKTLLEQHGIHHNLGEFLEILKRRIDMCSLYRIIPCYIGWILLVVQVGGDVYPCQRCYAPLGNAYQMSVRAVWYSPVYRQFRRAAGEINKRLTPVANCFCHDCCHDVTNLSAYMRLHLMSRRPQLTDYGIAARVEEE